jgi:hypothetical protein
MHSLHDASRDHHVEHTTEYLLQPGLRVIKMSAGVDAQSDEALNRFPLASRRRLSPSSLMLGSWGAGVMPGLGFYSNEVFFFLRVALFRR